MEPAPELVTYFERLVEMWEASDVEHVLDSFARDAGSLYVGADPLEYSNYKLSQIVPGHGSPTGVETLDLCLRYLEWIQHSAEQAIEAGRSPLEAVRDMDLGEFAELTDVERVVGNLHRAFGECRGEAPGASIDLSSAFGDMVAFNGGRPLRCLA